MKLFFFFRIRYFLKKKLKMDLDDLNYLPPWDEDDFDDEEGEAWKKKEARRAAKSFIHSMA